MVHSYLSPKLVASHVPEKRGMGVYALAALQPGELAVVWGGEIRNYLELMALPETRRRHSVQVEEGLYQVPFSEDDPADLVNHSCDANLGMQGPIALVAMREIAPGEEVCMDYAMCDGTPYDEFVCGCGAPTCRTFITGQDWSLPELWERYQGYFSPYLQRRINVQRSAILLQGAAREPITRRRSFAAK